MGSLFDWFGGGSSSNSSTQTKINKLEKEIETIKTTISNKVDKINGKGLSTNDFTNEYKNKIDNIETTSTPSTPVIINSDSGSYYVTPEMFGAVGDGNTDDTEAIQKAINSNQSIHFLHKTYLITKPIIITNKTYWNMYAKDAMFKYTGSDYAFRILSAMNCKIEIGYINAKNGGGIEFYSSGGESWNQYITLDFEAIECKTNCIRSYAENGGWCNENRVFGGRFMSGENGVYISHASGNATDGWKFYNCGIEGVKNGFMLDAGESLNGYICAIDIINPRYAESYETILKTKGFVFDCLWIGAHVFKPSEIDCSEDTSRFEVYAPIRTIWDGNLIRHRGCIIDGKLMAEKTEYETVK